MDRSPVTAPRADVLHAGGWASVGDGERRGVELREMLDFMRDAGIENVLA